MKPSNPTTDTQQLRRRIVDGGARIQEAQDQGRDVQAWEAFWLGLLREYVALCDELAPGAAKETGR